MAAGGDSHALRDACAQAYARCADSCEQLLTGSLEGELRQELVVCAAVCRVAAQALERSLPAAVALVEYSVVICRRCADALDGAEAGSLRAGAARCTDAADAATTFLLAS